MGAGAAGGGGRVVSVRGLAARNIGVREVPPLHALPHHVSPFEKGPITLAWWRVCFLREFRRWVAASWAVSVGRWCSSERRRQGRAQQAGSALSGWVLIALASRVSPKARQWRARQ